MNAIFASSGNPLSFLTNFGVEWDILFSQALMFIILSVILYNFVFKPVAKTADERKAKIEQGLKDAELANEKLIQSERDCSAKISQAAVQASLIFSKAREDAKAIVEKAAAEASEKAARIILDAKDEIGREREKMKSELKSEIAALVVKTSEAVLMGALDETTRAKISALAAKDLTDKGE